MNSTAVFLLVTLVCVGQTLGFAYRVYPGFKTSTYKNSGFLQPLKFPFTTGISYNMPVTMRQPVLEETTITSADPQATESTSDPGLKAITFRRAGPLDQCDNYLDCKARLLSYFNVMMKMSNKG